MRRAARPHTNTWDAFGSSEEQVELGRTQAHSVVPAPTRMYFLVVAARGRSGFLHFSFGSTTLSSCGAS